MSNLICLQTNRLTLRDHRIEDLETHHKLFSNSQVMYYLPGIQTHTYEESKQNLLDAILQTEKENRTEYFLRIEDRKTNTHIGEIGYTVKQLSPYGKIVDLGYFINLSFWGKGYACEALREMITFAFRENDVYRIGAGCLAENKGSERVMQTCGLIQEAAFKSYTLHDGKMKDRVEYRLLKSEWMEQQN